MPDEKIFCSNCKNQILSSKSPTRRTGQDEGGGLSLSILDFINSYTYIESSPFSEGYFRGLQIIKKKILEQLEIQR